MKTLLLDTKGNVYKIVSELVHYEGLAYICERGVWCPTKGDYLFDTGLVEKEFIHESDVELIDTNTAIIVNAKATMMGFGLDYLEDFDYV